MSVPNSPLKIERQAIILIHGMGEQRPMDTLGSFVDNLAPKSKEAMRPLIIANLII